MAAAETRMQSLVAGGASYDDPEVQGLREQIANMKIGLAQEEVGLADVPMSGQQREKLATLQGETALMRMGYGGTAGGIRGNLMRQIAVMGERAEDLNRTEAALKSSGRWNDAMAARFAEQRSEVALHAAGLQSEYDEGFDQRLISRAYNMPPQGRLVMSGFTRRESAFSGVYNRLFGGTLEQTRRMRVDTPARLHAMLSSGHPMGMEDAGERFWLAVRGNIRRLADAREWWEVCRGAVAPALDDPEYVISQYDANVAYADREIGVLLAKVTSGEATAILPAAALRMVTTVGARLLGRDDLGRLVPEAKADLTLVNLNNVRSMPVHQPASALVYNAVGPDVQTVIVDGRVLLDRGEVTVVDEAALLVECRAAAKRLLKRAGVE